MAINKGYLTAGRTKESDEIYTPFYAVDPLIEFIEEFKNRNLMANVTIWCPFDEEWSAFVQVFKTRGYDVISTSLANGQDFFTYLPHRDFDLIISNPPFSKKDEVLDRLYALNKPFAVLLPIASLQSKNRYKNFKQGLELLVFDSRIDYHTNGDFQNYRKGNHFGSGYFCRDFLPEKLIFRALEKYNKPLIQQVRREG